MLFLIGVSPCPGPRPRGVPLPANGGNSIPGKDGGTPIMSTGGIPFLTWGGGIPHPDLGRGTPHQSDRSTPSRPGKGVPLIGWMGYPCGCGRTDASENITFPILRMRAVTRSCASMLQICVHWIDWSIRVACEDWILSNFLVTTKPWKIHAIERSKQFRQETKLHR